MILPPIPDDLNADAKNKLATRNACATEGKCPCCGTVRRISPDADCAGLSHYTFAHEDWCVVVA